MEGESELQRPKCSKFNLKQLIGRNGVVILGMLDRLLESTSISATDVESGQTLLEHACRTNNISLAKLCYRRGAPLHECTASGETPFNIATKNKSYRLMECLRMYGVRVNSSDSEGQTALHIATAQDDVDGVCRPIEWGTDVNARDKHLKTPLHYAAIAGHMDMSMFLLELGADLNAIDDREYTPVAHAEANDHFQLMDRLVLLGGRGHRFQENPKSVIRRPMKYGGPDSERTARFNSPMGEVRISPLYLRKNSSLNRLGKYSRTTSLSQLA